MKGDQSLEAKQGQSLRVLAVIQPGIVKLARGLLLQSLRSIVVVAVTIGKCRVADASDLVGNAELGAARLVVIAAALHVERPLSKP